MGLHKKVQSLFCGVVTNFVCIFNPKGLNL